LKSPIDWAADENNTATPVAIAAHLFFLADSRSCGVSPLSSVMWKKPPLFSAIGVHDAQNHMPAATKPDPAEHTLKNAVHELTVIAAAPYHLAASHQVFCKVVSGIRAACS
jgi:hypothetical protein